MGQDDQELHVPCGKNWKAHTLVGFKNGKIEVDCHRDPKLGVDIGLRVNLEIYEKIGEVEKANKELQTKLDAKEQANKDLLKRVDALMNEAGLREQKHVAEVEQTRRDVGRDTSTQMEEAFRQERAQADADRVEQLKDRNAVNQLQGEKGALMQDRAQQDLLLADLEARRDKLANHCAQLSTRANAAEQYAVDLQCQIDKLLKDNQRHQELNPRLFSLCMRLESQLAAKDDKEGVKRLLDLKELYKGFTGMDMPDVEGSTEKKEETKPTVTPKSAAAPAPAPNGAGHAAPAPRTRPPTPPPAPRPPPTPPQVAPKVSAQADLSMTTPELVVQLDTPDQIDVRNDKIVENVPEKCTWMGCGKPVTHNSTIALKPSGTKDFFSCVNYKRHAVNIRVSMLKSGAANPPASPAEAVAGFTPIR